MARGRELCTFSIVSEKCTSMQLTLWKLHGTKLQSRNNLYLPQKGLTLSMWRPHSLDDCAVVARGYSVICGFSNNQSKATGSKGALTCLYGSHINMSIFMIDHFFRMTKTGRSALAAALRCDDNLSVRARL